MHLDSVEFFEREKVVENVDHVPERLDRLGDGEYECDYLLDLEKQFVLRRDR